MMGRWFGWGYGGFRGPGGFGGSSGFGILGALVLLGLGLIVLIALALVAVWLWRRTAVGQRSSGGRPVTASPQSGPVLSPGDVARLRYARGEITREQYQQLLVDLGQPSQ